MSQKTSVEERVISDEAIVELYWNRNEKAIKETDKKYGGYLLTIAYNIVRNKQDSEECLNDTYLRLWNAIPPERPQSLRAYAARIVRNLAIDRVAARETRKRSALLCELDDTVGDLSLAVFDGDDALSEALDVFLGTLAPPDAAVFIRRYWHSEPVGEIARYYGVTENAISKRLQRTRKRLRKFLTERRIL